jgi:hypothetical protein
VFRDWKRLLIVVAVAVVGLSVAAVAVGATRPQAVPRDGAGVCGAVMNDPAAAKAMQELRAEHRGEMQAWCDKYGSERPSALAQKALRDLRAEHWEDMKTLAGEYGIEIPRGGRVDEGAGGGCGFANGGACGGGAQGAGYGMMGSGGMMGGWNY